MAITAKISSVEIAAQVEQRFVGKYIEAMLLNAGGLTYTPGTTDDANFLSNEVAEGTGGYTRQVFSYKPEDRGAYADQGVGLATKGTIFAHNGSGTPVNFTHAVLVWGTGNVIAIDPQSGYTGVATEGNDGTYTNLPCTTDGSGVGLTIDVTVLNNVFTFTPSRFGRNYQPGDQVIISEAAMVIAGIVPEGGGSAALLVTSTSSNAEAGQIVGVARTASPVVLDGGNEAAFYWDVKMFGAS